jgi:acyl-coenzyme A thioesterase PaaI-like protein
MELPELHLEKVNANPLCFGCGKENPHGLKIKFIQGGEKTKCEFLPTEYHQAWPGYVHGGALMAAIDEGMGYCVFARGIFCVTAKIDIRLKSMARINEPLVISAWISKQTSRTVEAQAEVRRRDDSLVAEAEATLFIVK